MNKKSLLHFKKCSLPLLAAMIAVTTACSGDSSLQREYQIEKIFFKAQKSAAIVLINPRVAPTTEFEKAVVHYRRVVAEIDKQKLTPNLKNILRLSLSRMAHLEALRERPDEARMVYEDILRRFAPDDEVSLYAKLALGVLHERRFEYRDAIDAYSTLMPEISGIIEPEKPVPALLGLPLKFARITSYSKGKDKSYREYGQAKQIYREIIKKWPKSKAALQATSYLASILSEQAEWGALSDLIDRQLKVFTDSTNRPVFLFAKANLLHRNRGETERALQMFNKIIASFPEHSVVPVVRLEIARIYLERQKYEHARKLFKSIVENYRKHYNVAAAAQDAIAYSYDLENRWELAINEYRWLIKNYEVSFAALAAPVKIVEYYKNQNQRTLVTQAYQEALDYYQELTVKYPKSLVAAVAQEQIAHVYMAQNQWDNAVAAASHVKNILDNNTGEISTYLLLGRIYESSSHNQLAVKVYNEFIDRYPQHPLAEALHKKISALSGKVF